jgi:Protein of unknown function (DUF3047)
MAARSPWSSVPGAALRAQLMLVAVTLAVVPAAAERTELRFSLKAFRTVPSESGDVNYFQRMDSPSGDFIRATYTPPIETAVLGYEIPKEFRSRVTSLSWRWRALEFPLHADECVKERSDSAAVVYVTFRRGLRYYALKYVWSAGLPKGTVCDKKRNPFRAQDTIVLESGGPKNEWRTVRINPEFEFRKHFEDGDPSADVPDLIGIGLMSDGDQTNSRSVADYGSFVLTRQ